MFNINKEKIESKIDGLIKEANAGKTISSVNSHMAESLIRFKKEMLLMLETQTKLTKEEIENAALRKYEEDTKKIPEPTTLWVQSRGIQINSFIKGAEFVLKQSQSVEANLENVNHE